MLVQPLDRPRLRVLVVDDCPDTCKSLRLLLRSWGYDSREAIDGEAALSLAAGFLPEVVFLDLIMPRLDGYETARRIRHLVPAGRLLAMTGHSGPGDVLAAVDAGFDHYLIKPCPPNELHRLLLSFAEEQQSEPV